MEIPSGYAFSASSDAEWLTIAAQEDGLVKLAVARNTGSESRSASVKAVLTDGTPLADITVNQSWRNVEPGELLIEEVYFSGSPLEGSDRSSDDQYIRLTNNADHTIYADRVMFVTNFITGTITSAGAYYEYPDVEDGIVVEDMYVIPGSGDEYPLEPGASLILAISAENYQENNPAAFDLSKADFEFYGSDNDYFPDTDNPTEYEVLAQSDAFSFLRLVPQTGRTHQLRVHMAALGCPLAGDWLYGTEDPSLIRRPALHSCALWFTQPVTGEAFHFTAPLPEDMAALLRKI